MPSEESKGAAQWDAKIMPIKTLLFLGGFAAVAVATFFHPLIGVLGYAANYCIGPERQWWAAARKPQRAGAQPGLTDHQEEPSAPRARTLSWRSRDDREE